MYKPVKQYTIKARVEKLVKSHIESKGTPWILSLSIGECNDYAESVAAILECRYETVARRIRELKAKYRRELERNQAAHQNQTNQ